MKNLFTLDVATGEYRYNKFIEKRIDGSVSEKQTNAIVKLTQLNKKYSLPIYFKIIECICGLLSAIIIIGFFDALAEGTSLAQAYSNASWIFYVGGASLIIFAMLFGISLYLNRKGNKAPDVVSALNEMQEILKDARRELGVPEDADELDILLRPIIIKKGKEKPASPFMQYGAQVMKIFTVEEKLYIADNDSLTALPLACITSITANKKRSQVHNWTKDEKCKSEKYKPYKIRVSNYGFNVKTYSVRFSTEGEEYEILVPNYEIEILKKYLSAFVTE